MIATLDYEPKKFVSQKCSCGRDLSRTDGNERSGSGYCSKCGWVHWASTQYPPTVSERLEEKRKKSRCSLCHGSGYDSKGKPCRRC